MENGQNGANGRAFLSASQLMDAAKRRRTFETVELPLLGGAVNIGKLPLGQKDAFDLSLLEEGPDGKKRMSFKNFTPKLLAACLWDEQCKPMYTEAQIAGIAEWDTEALEPAIKAARRLNGFDAQTVAEVQGNSDSDQLSATS